MRLRWWNKNLVGTHYGGSLYSMCDPFYVFILICNLGEDFIIWDKAANIRFKKPGKGTVKALFEIEQAEIECIREKTLKEGKMDCFFETVVKNEAGEVVAEVEKVVYVRKK